jgi:hypothetical protein
MGGDVFWLFACCITVEAIPSWSLFSGRYSLMKMLKKYLFNQN